MYVSPGVGMCTALMALLHAMSYRASFHQLEMLFTYVQLQWESLVGRSTDKLLIAKENPYC